jgi:catechol 2,3-dioxygenase-like lactoylglutathione lyase family enzyme
MSLGQFSISLSVKDIRASRDFYLKLGFEILDDHETEKWMILRKDDAVVGLFQGMFPRNMLTFNPADVRAIQRGLKANGLKLDAEADESTSGPAHVMLTDPDGNPILIDQHDPNYKPTSKK